MDRARSKADACSGCSLNERPADTATGEVHGRVVDGAAGRNASRGSRRDFVLGTSAALAGLLVGIGGWPSDLSALPIDWVRGKPGERNELTFPLPAADGVTIDRQNELILVRWQSKLFAFALSCPHQRSMLKWRDGDSMFQCSKHKSKYQPNGTFVSGRATRGMDRYPLRVAGGQVTVLTGAPILQDEDEAAWNAATVDLDA